MKKTILYDYHKEAGATFSEFAGYQMPLWYNSAKNEHLNVIKNIGLFDTSHMSLISIKGLGANKLLINTFSRNISPLKFGHSIYGVFLKADNSVLDDTIIYKITDDDYMVVVNAGMSESVISHLNSFNYTGYEIKDYSDKLGKIDVQGPKSLLLMEKIFGKDMFVKFPYFSFKGSLKNEDILISRSGYTGEFGFELYVNKDLAIELWNKLLKYGEEFGITPCGLAARDSLRVGAGLPLSHQDIGNWEFCNTPWDFALDNPLKSKSSYTYGYVGYDVRKLKEDHGRVIFNSEDIGEVLSCITEVSITRIENKILSVTSPELTKDSKIKGLVAGFIKVDSPLKYGEIVTLIDGTRNLEVEIVDNIRPNRTARYSVEKIRSLYE